MQFTIYSPVIIVPVLLAWIVTTSIRQTRGTYHPSLARYSVLTAFVVYLLALIHVTVFPVHVHTGTAKDAVVFQQSINRIPFADIRPLDFVLNVVMTLPLGMFLPIVFRRRFSITGMLVIAISTGLIFELNQLVLRELVANDRFIDVNDVVANGTGVLAGYALCLVVTSLQPLNHWVSKTVMS